MDRPLDGFTIGITADRRADEQISMLSGRGAEVVHGPTIRTHPLRPEGEIAEATQMLLAEPPDLVLVSTAIGFRSWLGAADSLGLGEALRDLLGRVPLVSRGPKARGAVVTAGLDVEWNAATATYAEVVTHLGERGIDGHRVAIQLDGGPSQALVAGIESLGASVVAIPVYRWSLPDDCDPAAALVRQVADRRVDALTFTARPAVEHFVAIADSLDCYEAVQAACADRVRVFSVGPVCAAAVHEHRLGSTLQPRAARLGSLVTCITEELAGRTRELAIGGHRVEWRGNRVVVEGAEPVTLTGRERDVFDALAARPGVVSSKADLLERVWGREENDPHVVEVTIGRLRRRLGPAGVGIETVMRRGYRVSEV
ncbi:MAG: uroporphyrinogen-III synthase [Actinomycetota bacterium]